MSVGSCSIIAGPTYVQFIPRSPRAGRKGVLLFHGAGSPTEYTDPVAQLQSVLMAQRIASEGIYCVSGPFSGNTWGNDTAVTDTTSAFTQLQSMGASSSSFVGIGVSMGATNLIRYAVDNPTKMAAGVGILPLVDLKAFYAANTGGNQASIAAAWGVTAPAALPARADVANTAIALRGMPWLVGYSSGDDLIPPSTVTTFASLIGPSCTATVISNLIHSDAAVGGFVTAAIPDGGRSSLLDFLIANGC